MQTAVIIVAAGAGLRAGGPLAKQWQPLAGRSLVQHCVDRFAAHPGVARIVVVVPPGSEAALWPRTDAIEIGYVEGGATRQASVRAGLGLIEGTGLTHVLIHDAARPLVPAAVIDRVLAALAEGPAAAPALEVVDALWRGTEGQVTGTQDRAGLWRAQTPQGFDLRAILDAHRRFAGVAADDVEIARAAGLPVRIVAGDEAAFKITHQDDFHRAEKELQIDMDVRTGNGFDVHRFGPGDHLWLCGVRIPFDRGLEGHSDADVGLHAVTDAIYGALGDGDIGQHFPPSDPQWKGTASHVFLAHACDLARANGFEISHTDCTLICELPKIGPHAIAMKSEIARIAGLDPGRISVKATTSERLGFTGRGEGIAALATATLVRR